MKNHYRWEAYLMAGVPAVILLVAVLILLLRR
jgi:hypothetical protein